MDTTLPLSNLQMLVALVLVLVPAATSVALRLGLGGKILLGSTRLTVQLFAVGFVLTWIFGLQKLWAVVLAVSWMVLAASWEAVGRTQRRYGGIYLDVFLSICISALIVLGIGTALVVRSEPWWAPRYLIPILGMLLGNSMTGISLGLSVWLEGITERKDRVESLLALGATKWEAAREGVSEALRRALIPILNMMGAAGIVSLPGMMTGQILAGNPPALAVRYQIVIVFLIAATTATGALGAVILAYRRLFDEEHRLRLDRLAAKKA